MNSSPTLQQIVNAPADGYEGVMRRLLRVEERDISLKGIFDHFRNYLICAGLLSGAIAIAKFGAVLAPLPSVRITLALLVAALALALMAANFFQGLVLASALGISRWAGYLLGPLMVTVIGNVVVAVGLHSL